MIEIIGCFTVLAALAVLALVGGVLAWGVKAVFQLALLPLAVVGGAFKLVLAVVVVVLVLAVGIPVLVAVLAVAAPLLVLVGLAWAVCALLAAIC